MYANEHSMRLPPRRGIDFQFQMYGGSLLDFICITQENLSEEEGLYKLIDMFSFSRNAFVVIDSDSLVKDGVVKDNSSFKKAKEFIQGQFIKLTEEKGYKIGLWYDENNTNVYSIENYLDDATIEVVGKRTKNASKVIYARKVVDSWDTDKKLGGFKGQLKSRIEDLVNCIHSWNA